MAENKLNNFFQNLTGVKFINAEMFCLTHGKLIGNKAIYPDGSEIIECPRCIEERELKESKEFEMQQKRALIQKYQDSNIEIEYLDKSIDDYIPQTEKQKKLLELVKNMIESKSGKLIVLGSNGIGKTMLASMVVKELGGKILSMYEISTMIRQSYTNRAEKTELEIVKELASIPFLAIDELGRTKGSDAELNWLSYVLDKRHTRNLPFMIMSNTHLSSECPNNGCSQCFENYINNDILSRLRQNSKIITVDGPDYRAKK